jgi:peptidoglycan/LPS O-acetylase OafA/YrhL
MTCWQREIRAGLTVAALLIGLMLALVGARSLDLPVDRELATRLFGIMAGLICAYYGNAIPRQLVRYEPDSTRPARKQALLRFAGWAFVLGGLGNALAWLLLPLDQAALWSMVPLGLALALVALRVLRPPVRPNGA